MNDDITVFPLGLPINIVHKEIPISIRGIASFYINYGDACYIYLLGHKLLGDESIQNYPSNPDVLLIDKEFRVDKVTQGKKLKTTQYKPSYDEFFDTNIGVFLKRPSIGSTLKVLQSNLIPKSLIKDMQNTSIPIGKPKPGPAQILTTTVEIKPRLYNCVINEIFEEKKRDTSFRICVNDSDLLNTVGGARIGMSGSVIIQNGTIVGVLARVLGGCSNYAYVVSMDQIMQKLSEIKNNFDKQETKNNGELTTPLTDDTQKSQVESESRQVMMIYVGPDGRLYNQVSLINNKVETDKLGIDLSPEEMVDIMEYVDIIWVKFDNQGTLSDIPTTELDAMIKYYLGVLCSVTEVSNTNNVHRYKIDYNMKNGPLPPTR